MEEFENCPICFEIFTFPKILICGHTFCFGCLKDICSVTSSQNQELKCPLCRAKITIPESGLNNLVTNYFTRCSKPTKICMKCKIFQIASSCPECNINLCTKCFKIHVHSLSSSTEVVKREQRQQQPGSLLFVRKLKCIYECEVKTHFVIETPPNDEGWHNIYSLRPSKSGHIFVVARGDFVQEYNNQGRLLYKISTSGQCHDILETKDGNLLGVFPSNKMILKYVNNSWIFFAFCSNFIPLSLVELSNRDIAVCGPDNSSIGTYIKKSGHIEVFSLTGKPVRKFHAFHEIARNTKLLCCPEKMASNQTSQTIAVIDNVNHSVIVLKEDGQIMGIYTGNSEIPALTFPVVGIHNCFHPMGICCALDGAFLIPTPDDCLHILEYSGKLRGLAFTDCEDGFGRNVFQDKNGVIWCSDSTNGTVRAINIVKFHNNFKNNYHNPY